jgi:hypothetical protein
MNLVDKSGCDSASKISLYKVVLEILLGLRTKHDYVFAVQVSPDTLLFESNELEGLCESFAEEFEDFPCTLPIDLMDPLTWETIISEVAIVASTEKGDVGKPYADVL